MSDFIGIDVTGLDEIKAKLEKLPQEAKDEAIDEVSKYLIEVLKAYPSQKSVTLQQAYGGFKSEKQRRFFFASLADGSITVPYRRSQTLRNAWKQYGVGEKSIIANETPYAGYVMGDNTQANMHRIIGWKTISTVLQERAGRIQEKLKYAVERAIKKLGLG